MKYSFLGFSVSKMMDLNLDMKDVAILRYFVDFKDTGKFGAKFEQYLNQKVVSSDTKQNNSYEKSNNYERPKLRFDNFKGRDYDYKELERKLLGW